ncbi:MAG: RNase P subunit p30 family protein [Aigarchaeota archaeon]|nr:RNase P subunit p30 family protein [Candidatus Pelearchaeum maunauluense]
MDFWVKARTLEEAEKLLERLSSLGFSACCLETGMEGKEYKEVAEVGVAYKMEVVRKRVVEARSRIDVLQALRKKKPSEICAVTPRTREAFLVAARDERVDTIIIHEELVELDRHILKVLKNFLELPLDTVFKAIDDSTVLTRLVNVLRVVAAVELPLIISSGASLPERLRSPRQLAAVLNAFGIEQVKSLDAVSNIPEQILGRWRAVK